MSYAVESKKRKFHRMLESISKPITDNVSKSAASATTSATAQDRLPTNLSIKKVRLSSGDQSDLAAVRNSIQKISRPAHQLASASSNKRPSFVPWDRERFLERLETFRRVDRWTSKPTPINEVQWAKCGWICTDTMRVSCISGCGGSVVVKLPDEIDELDGYDAEKVQERKEVRAKLVEEFAKLLHDGHGENCPWRNRGCDDTIQHLPLTNADTALAGLRKRYLNMLQMGDKLPADDVIQSPESFKLDELLKILPEDWSKTSDKPAEDGEAGNGNNQDSAEAQPSMETPLNRAALTLAFFGWDAVSDGAAGLVGCGACFRRLGLWMYKPKANGDVTVYASLDVALEHMEYCPWIDRLSQSGTGKPNQKMEDLRSGWELVAQAVRVKHRRHLRSTTSMDTVQTDASSASADFGGDDENDEAKKTADREWWAKIRRMRQLLTTKSPRRKSVIQ
ncbi:hypothetical protein N7474_002755 [Penicillium riverlandense]|uniref:uncharacterized protein n=1 Tax=Penicillium riverlandense TaxID=1903569 RepID=UPI002546E03D|nr:uncharacterized protein N7474_002755 [Penicillium riverlandense]KAJ5825617.1 hypothetical protein N7474_002755 [Penicillium riverlandense]